MRLYKWYQQRNVNVHGQLDTHELAAPSCYKVPAFVRVMVRGWNEGMPPPDILSDYTSVSRLSHRSEAQGLL